MTSADDEGVATAGRVQVVLDAEAERQSRQREAAQEVLLPDDQLPGVGDETITLRDGVRFGGSFAFVVLVLLQAFGELQTATLSVLAPDIRDSFGVDNGTVVFLGAAAGAFLAIGVVPMGWLADRLRRAPVIGCATLVFSAMVFVSGLAANAFALFCARLGAGVSASNALPVQGSLIADSYPIAARGRVNFSVAGAARLGLALGPAIVGGIAAAAGGTEGWRWAYLVLAVPMIPLGILAFRIPEPARGQFEMTDVLDEVVDDEAAPTSAEATFRRLLRIRTLKTMLLALAAIGFGLYTVPVVANLYLDDHFGVGVFGRGVVASVTAASVLIVLPFAARHYDALYRQDPVRALRLLGLLLVPVAAAVPVQYAMPNEVFFTIVGIVPGILLFTTFAMAIPIIQSVVPHRLRGHGIALAAIYIFFVGATGGGILAAFFTSTLSPRAAVVLLSVPSALFGGLLVMRGASSIKQDLSLVVVELREQRAEEQRRDVSPATIPALQIDAVDYSYGHVQVLFDVGFEVRRGEVLALLGTNGAGKTTTLRVIAGLGTPSRGVVRLNGTPITYLPPEQRVKHGIRLLPGGNGVFPHMTIRENLEMGAYIYRRNSADRERRIARVLELFPALAGRQGEMATSLSGGQQQMLALAITLLHDPDVLLVDELSLGLAPIIVEQLLGVVEQLKRDGTTIVIVEQSLNLAMSVADRAVFLEKGRVRFEGSAEELAAREDLVRAVFLGDDGG